MNTQVKVKPLELRAITIGKNVHSIIKDSGNALPVEGVFDHAIYLNGSGEGLIKIVSDEGFQSPASILVELEKDGFKSSGAANSTEVEFDNGALFFGSGNLSICIENSEIYDPPVVPEPEHLSSLEEINLNLRILKDTIYTAPSREGLVGLLENVDKLGPMQLYTKEQTPSIAEKARPHIDRLMWGIFGGDLGAIKQSAAEILGLGPGLTPSCDDFLAGLLMSINTAGVSIFGKEPETLAFFEKVSDAVAGLAREKTTIYSQSLLNEAASGSGPLNALDLIISVVTRGPDGITEPAKRLLKVGETSGADIAVGIYYGIRFLTSRIEMKELLEFE